MKRIVCLLLSAVLLLGLMGPGALAEDNLKVVFSNAAAEAGEEVEVTVSLENNPGIIAFSGKVTYDESLLTLVSAEALGPTSGWDIEEIADDHNLLWADDKPFSGTDLVKLIFHVAENAPNGKTSVTITFDPDWDVIGDENGVPIEDYEIVPGTVTIGRVLDDGYYLIGIDGWDVSSIRPEHQFVLDKELEQEYLLTTTLDVGNKIKVVKVENNAITAWYPDNGGNYVVDGPHSGEVNIYFRPGANPDWYSFHTGGFFYIAARHTIIVDTGIENGTVTADKTSAAPQEDVVVTVEPAAGYELDELYYLVEDGTTQTAITETDGVYTFKMPAGNVTIYATFKLIKYTVTVSDSIENGTVTAAPATAAPGETVTVTVAPETGYELATLTRTTGAEDHYTDITEKDEEGNYIFEMPAGNVTIMATFTAKDFSVALEANIEDVVTVDPTTAKVNDTISLTAAEGYKVTEAYYVAEGSEEQVPITFNGLTAQFTMPAANVTVHVTLEKLPADGYYLIGGMTEWKLDEAYLFTANPSADGEYLLETNLPVGTEIKVVKAVGGEIDTWYPDGRNYKVDEPHSNDVTVYFRPAGNSEWNSFHEGGFFFIAAKVVYQAVPVYGSSLSLRGNIALNFFVIPTEQLLNDENAYVVLEVAAVGGTETVTIPFGEAKTRTVGNDTLYEFSVKLHAKQMSDVVTMRIYAGDGTLISLVRNSDNEPIPETGFSYCVRDYVAIAPTAFNKQTLTDLVNAMSDYGALAQMWFSYNLDNCPTPACDLSSVTADALAVYEEVIGEGTVTGVSYAGGSLVLDSETAIRLYFNVTEGSIGDYIFKVGTKEVTPELTDDGYRVEIPDITAKNLDRSYTVFVTKDGDTVLTVKYSALSYVYGVLSRNDKPQQLIDLVKGIYLYNRAADAYFGN